MKRINYIFKPLYFKDKLKIINPEGFIGVVTLWSGVEWVAKRLSEIDADFSKIAVIGNLRGNGFPYLIRNLLYNPQITHLVCCGRNRYGSLEDLVFFFTKGVEQVKESSPYHFNNQTIPAVRIIGRTRILDSLVKPEDFKPKPEITYLGELQDSQSLETARKYFSGVFRTKHTLNCRKKVPLPEVSISTLPCSPASFTITKKDVVQAWEELVFILYRFGRTVRLAKGGRKELQNVKVIVEQPVKDPGQRLLKYWFNEDKIKSYQNDILSGEKPEDVSYTYGHRIRSYFGIDGLTTAIERLLKDNEDRKCFIALWDTGNDMGGGRSTPCLVSLFFRYYEKKLTLTANYRTHNAIDAWIYNFYGLKAILDFVADKTGMKPGAITVISNSISIDLDESTIARAALLVKNRKTSIKTDSNGIFNITVDKQKNEIIARHCTEDGLLIHEYRGKKAESIQHKIYRDMAVSDLNHAMYIGRQLAQAELELKEEKDEILKM